MGLEQGADVGFVAFLNGGSVAVTGVVDQHVDAAEPLLGLAGSGGDLVRVGDVESQSEHAIWVALVGATKSHHLADAVAAVAIELTEDEVAALEEPYVPQSPAGF